jgi:hypothetical protein
LSYRVAVGAEPRKVYARGAEHAKTIARFALYFASESA